MTKDEFDETLDRLGPVLDSWPPDLRNRAAALLEGDIDARRLLDADRILATVLADPPGEMASDALRRAILGIPLKHPRPHGRPDPLAWLRDGAAGVWRAWSAGAVTAAAAVLMGFYLGYGGLLTLPGLTGTATAVATPEQELVELVVALETELPQ